MEYAILDRRSIRVVDHRIYASWRCRVGKLLQLEWMVSSLCCWCLPRVCWPMQSSGSVLESEKKLGWRASRWTVCDVWMLRYRFAAMYPGGRWMCEVLNGQRMRWGNGRVRSSWSYGRRKLRDWMRWRHCDTRVMCVLLLSIVVWIEVRVSMRRVLDAEVGAPLSGMDGKRKAL